MILALKILFIFKIVNHILDQIYWILVDDFDHHFAKYRIDIFIYVF